jgi:hypothetical protein
MISAYVRGSVKPRVSRAPRLEQALQGLVSVLIHVGQSLGENEV